jgi:acyl-CoA thioesterase I
MLLPQRKHKPDVCRLRTGAFYLAPKEDHVVATTKKIEVFGDSILKGIQVNPKNMRYHVNNNIDIEIISRKHSLKIENHSQFGCTIRKGYSVLRRHLENGMACDMIVMDYGGNDCDFNWKAISEKPDDDYIPNTPLGIFAETYHQIIRELKQRGIIPILTTLPPLEPQRFFDWFCKGLNKINVLNWLGSVNAIYRYQENYSRTIEKIAFETGVPIIDLRGAFLEHRRIDNLLCLDGTHPSTEGQKVIATTFLDFADKMATV